MSNRTYQVASKLVGLFGMVPQFVTECDSCHAANQWGTTGLWPNSIGCKLCGKVLSIPSPLNIDVLTSDDVIAIAADDVREKIDGTIITSLFC